MPYLFIRTKDFVGQYQASNPGKDGMLWIDLLTEALNVSRAEVVSVGYDGIAEPMTMLLKVTEAAPGGESAGF